ncbi:deoxynucleoside kinase, partial [Bacillus sp. D-CC]
MTGVPFITVEGPIGVGKTSLAKEISTHMQLHLLKEIVDENSIRRCLHRTFLKRGFHQ